MNYPSNKTVTRNLELATAKWHGKDIFEVLRTQGIQLRPRSWRDQHGCCDMESWSDYVDIMTEGHATSIYSTEQMDWGEGRRKEKPLEIYAPEVQRPDGTWTMRGEWSAMRVPSGEWKDTPLGFLKDKHLRAIWRKRKAFDKKFVGAIRYWIHNLCTHCKTPCRPDCRERTKLDAPNVI